MSQNSVSHGSYKIRSLRDKCHCGLDVPLMTSWIDTNPGRRFYGCVKLIYSPLIQLQGFKKCNNFIWLDEEMNTRAKEVISSLIHNLEEEKQRAKDASMKEEEIRTKMKLMKKQLKFNWSITILVLVALVIAIIMK
ncbi:uncharacterized protein LOC131645470 [Vicia villosa]|uniref:uncharacterized protein LOC131645470 n=1 Tax=Vicia villosa TaxID=3911 RepID=UPI00273C891F|nr:uncharacterized protein LOC131645470 [Vicia villosa]